jgi:hypothetical protein
VRKEALKIDDNQACERNIHSYTKLLMSFYEHIGHKRGMYCQDWQEHDDVEACVTQS